MTPMKNSYDNDADERHSVGRGSEADELRRITGIGADEEGAMEREAGLGAVEDHANKDSSEPASPKGLNKAEQTGQKPAGDEPEENAPGNEPKKKQGFWSKKKAAAGVTGAVLLGGGGFFGFSLIAPTASVIQLGSILQSTHLQRKEDDADNRFMQLARYLYFRGGNRVERSRLGLVGNTVADRVQARVTKQTGLTPVYDQGELKGFTYDDNTYDKDGNRTGSRGGTAELEKNGIPITGQRDGKPFISTEGLSDRNTRRLNRTIVKESGLKGLSASLSSAIGGKRAGLTRHPVKQIVRKKVADLETRRAERKKERAENIKQGDSITISTTRGDTETDGNANADSDPDGVQNEANDLLGDAAEAQEANAAGDGSGTQSLREKVTGKLSGGIAAVVGIGCIARGIDQGAETIKQDQVIFPMMRMSMEMVSLASQMKSGQDIDMTEVGFYADQLYDSETKTGVDNAQTYRESTGQTGGTDADETAKTATTFSTPFSFLNDGSPLAEGLGAVCNVLGNQAVGLVLTILGGPVSFVAGLIVEQVTGPIIDEFTKWLAGDPINPDAKGAEYVNYMFYGGALIANQQFVAAGGRELSDEEVAQIKSDEAEDNQFQFKSESIARRVFDINDNRSLMGSFVSKVNPDISAGATNALATIINPSSYIGTFSKLFTPKASAATATYKYPFKTIGYSVAENNNPKVADPVRNANDVIDRIMPANSGFRQRANDCYGAVISDDFTDVRMDLNAKPNPYSRTYPSYNCSDKSEDWLQVRRYISDTVDVDTTACREGEAESCERLGLTEGVDAGEAATGTTGSTGTLPTGTAQELAQQVLANPNILPQSGNNAIMTKIAQTGKLTQCGAPAVDPRALGMLLQMSQKYKIYYGSILDGRVDESGSPICNDGQHPLGKAIDLVGANPLSGEGGTGSYIHTYEMNAAQKTFYGTFLTDLGATLAASGGGALGQGDCATRNGVNYTKADGVLYFNGDTCDHQHMDTR